MLRIGPKIAAPAALAALLAVAALPAARGAGSDPAGRGDLTPEAREAVRAGVEWLIDRQNADGSWLTNGTTGRFPTAVTALAGLALLAEGNTAYSGPRAANVRGAVEFLLRRADSETGLIGSAEGGRPMFGHGYAMLFLAQVYGSEARPGLRRRIAEALRRAVALTAESQSELGGWYYQPDSAEDEGAVTITQMQGLRACANAGLPVPRRTVEGARDYIRASANPDGGIAYRAGAPGRSRPGITCAAVATLYAAGIYEGELVEGALRYALENTSTRGATPAGGAHFFYSHLYLSQAMYFRGGRQWRDYFAEIQDWLSSVQRADGSWNGDYIGTAYGTAVALLILQLPRHNMPMFQR
ncbi:MAG: prenyltransferase/squalene oxidase repeat-containing protein [Planctomycetota bacterium]